MQINLRQSWIGTWPTDETTPQTYRTKEQMVKHMIKELDYVITVSDSIKEWYRTIDPQLPVQVIYNSPPLAANYESKKRTIQNSPLYMKGL